MSSAKWRPFCVGFNVLIGLLGSYFSDISIEISYYKKMHLKMLLNIDNYGCREWLLCDLHKLSKFTLRRGTHGPIRFYVDLCMSIWWLQMPWHHTIIILPQVSCYYAISVSHKGTNDLIQLDGNLYRSPWLLLIAWWHMIWMPSWWLFTFILYALCHEPQKWCHKPWIGHRTKADHWIYKLHLTLSMFDIQAI